MTDTVLASCHCGRPWQHPAPKHRTGVRVVLRLKPDDDELLAPGQLTGDYIIAFDKRNGTATVHRLRADPHPIRKNAEAAVTLPSPVSALS